MKKLFVLLMVTFILSSCAKRTNGKNSPQNARGVNPSCINK